MRAGRRRPPIFEPLTAEGFAGLWSANLLWYLTRWMEQVVIGWLVLELTNSPWLVALVGFWRNGPLLALGLFGGELADRFDRRQVLVAAQSVNVAVVLITLYLLLTGQLTYPAIAVGQLLLGASWAIDWPSRRSAMMDVVGSQRIVSAVLLDSVSMNVSRVVGALVGGGLIATLGVEGCYVLLCVVYGLSLAAVLRLRLPARARSAAGHVWRNLVEGLQYCRRNDRVMAVLLVTTAMNMLAFPHQQLLPVFARDVLDMGPAGLGLLAACDGIGALAASFAIGAMGPRMSRPGAAFLYGSLGMCLALFAFAWSRDYTLSVVALIGFGVMHASFSAFQSSLILVSTSPELRGRAMGVLTIAIGTSPIGALEMGALASAAGAPLAVGIGAVAALLWVAWSGWRYPGLRQT